VKILKISEELIEEIRRSNDIVEVIGEYVNLKKAGKHYQGLCPFHGEKTPSFSVTVDKQLFHCFGCKAGGDVFNFLMRIEKIDFLEAVILLAKRAGITLPESEKGEKDYLYEANSLANRYFHYLLCQTKIGFTARDYLQKRGITEKTIEKFRLGYAPKKWDSLLKVLAKRGVTGATLEKIGLVIAKSQGGYYDRFRDRLIFPIMDVRGKVIGFGGRVMDNTLPKYLNSPETALYSKSKNLYGLSQTHNEIKEKQQVVIVEGYLDFLSLYQSDIKNVVASLGTALTVEQAKLLARYAKEAIVAYDGDLAGAKAALRGLEILQSQGLKVRVLVLPKGEDPDSLVRKKGKETFLNLLEKALPWMDYCLELIFSDYEKIDGKSKQEIVERLLPLFSKLVSSIERDEYLRGLAEKLSIREEILRAEMAKFMKNTQRGKLRNKQEKTRHNKNDSNFSLPSLTTEKTLLALILKEKKLALWSQKVLSSEDFFYNQHKRIFSLIGELINIVDEEWAQWIENLDDEQLKENFLALLLEEIPQGGEPEKIALDCLQALKKYHLEDKITQLQQEIKQAEERGEYTRVRSLLNECGELIRLSKDLPRD